MTRDTVATTLQLQVDHTPPRVHHRLTPVDVIDISAASDLSVVPVRFTGWEECVLLEDDDRCAAFGQSPQWVNWVMRDDARTIAAGRSPLTMQLNDTTLEWIGDIELPRHGKPQKALTESQSLSMLKTRLLKSMRMEIQCLQEFLLSILGDLDGSTPGANIHSPSSV